MVRNHSINHPHINASIMASRHEVELHNGTRHSHDNHEEENKLEMDWKMLFVRPWVGSNRWNGCIDDGI